jgi:glycosyltransferase involved in cell wall biosynthesis
MKKIFITIPWFVPAFRAGGPVQSIANLVKEFQEGVDYYIFCGDTDLNGAELEHIETGKWIRYNDHTRIWYAGPQKISDTLVKQIEIVKPDILYIIGLFSWHYNIVPMLFGKAPKKILSTRGMLHAGALSQKKWKKKIYLQLLKLFDYHDKVHFHAADEDERDYILNYFGDEVKVSVAGNFPNKISPLPVAPKQKGSLKLASIALVSPIKNILLVLEALAQSAYNIDYDIYGPIKDEDYWDLCKKIIQSLPENIQVNYHKEIEPQRVKEALFTTHVFILPSKSENFGHAIYEALSAARPVITSLHTPWKNLKESNAGINVSHEESVEIVDAIGFFAEMDDVEMDKWSKGAFDYSEKALDAGRLREEYREMFG